MLKSRGTLIGSPTITVHSGYGYHANSSENSDWKLRLTGIVHQLPDEFRGRKRMLIRMLRNVMQVPQEELESDLFRQRISPFLADPLHRCPIAVRIGDQVYRLPGKTRRNGHFSAWLRVPASEIDRHQVFENGVARIGFEVFSEREEIEPADGEAFLHQRDGICVVSDIDDTIKHSVVTDRRELLANTFLREFRGVPGMADVYRQWQAAGWAFHYVSSSPWQLFHALRQLQHREGFPEGALHLRNFRLRDQLLKRVMIIRRQGKATAIRSLLKSLPHRRFVLVGDSGEKDPEIYARICRKDPGRVAGVFIRELPGQPLDRERRAKLEEHPDVPFATFSDPKGLARLGEPLHGAASLASGSR